MSQRCEFEATSETPVRPPSLDPSPSRGEGRASLIDQTEGGPRPLTRRARHLRRNATFAERKLWEALGRKAIGGLRFRRQHPIGPYVADFFCPSAKLIIELDGYFHSDVLRARHDEVRTAWLNERGYRVLRFANGTILEAPDGVLDAIRKAIGLTP